MGLDKVMPGTVLQCLERQFPQDIVRYHHDSVFAVENASGRPQQESEKLACRLINAETVIRNSRAKLIDLFRKSLAADDDRECGYSRSASDELNREYLDLVFQRLNFKSHGFLGSHGN